MQKQLNTRQNEQAAALFIALSANGLQTLALKNSGRRAILKAQDARQLSEAAEITRAMRQPLSAPAAPAAMRQNETQAATTPAAPINQEDGFIPELSAFLHRVAKKSGAV